MEWAGCFGHNSAAAKVCIVWTVCVFEVRQGFSLEDFGKFLRLKTRLRQMGFPTPCKIPSKYHAHCYTSSVPFNFKERTSKSCN